MKKKFFTLFAASLMVGSAYAQCPVEGEVVATSIESSKLYYLRYTATNTTTDVADSDDYFAVTKAGAKDSVVCVTNADLAAKGDSAIWKVIKVNNMYQFQNVATDNYFQLPISEAVIANEFGWNFEATDTPAKLGYIYNYENYQVDASGTAVKMIKSDNAGSNLYATEVGWKKMTAAELNKMYSDWFKLTDNSATSQTTQAQNSHKAIESKFHAEGVNSLDTDTEYKLNVYGTKKYLNVDTTYYDRIGLLDSTKRLGGLVLTLDTITNKKAIETYQFTIWKLRTADKDSLAIQVHGIPVIATPNSGELFKDNTSDDATDNGWITLSSYDAGYNETALTAAEGCFSKKGMPNPQITMTRGKGEQIEAGYYYIYKGLTQDSAKVAVLSQYMYTSQFTWMANREGKELVAAAQWYVPETSYYPTIFNRETTNPYVDNLQGSAVNTKKFYSIVNADGDTIPNAYEIGGDTITMIKINPEDPYLGYKRFGVDAEETEVTEVYLQFNTEIMGENNLAYVVESAYATDSMLKVRAMEDVAGARAYKVMPVDTFSIGRDILTAISYKLYYVAGTDTFYVNSLSNVSYGKIHHTKDVANATNFLMRATYDEGKYQILAVPLQYGPTNRLCPNEGEIVKAADRIKIASSGMLPGLNPRYVYSQVSVAATTADVYRNSYLNELNGLWSFVPTVVPEYLSLEPGHYRVSSTENTTLAITANAANKNAILKAEQDKPGYEADWFKLWVDTVDTNVVRPTFLIGTAQQGLVADSLKEAGHMAYLKNSGTFVAPANDVLAANDSVSFVSALRVGSDSLQINDTTKIALAKNPAYTVALRKVDGAEGNVAYVEYRKDNTHYGYLAQSNGVLYYTTGNLKTALNNALTFEFEKAEEAPTANETIAAEGVTVIAGEGNVTINGAAGKKVVVSNILGQVVANTVLTSDNATIAAPAGVVVVAVEGEAAVKAIVK